MNWILWYLKASSPISIISAKPFSMLSKARCFLVPTKTQILKVPHSSSSIFQLSIKVGGHIIRIGNRLWSNCYELVSETIFLLPVWADHASWAVTRECSGKINHHYCYYYYYYYHYDYFFPVQQKCYGPILLSSIFMQHCLRMEVKQMRTAT